jgi:hypothetical protein
VPPMLKESGGFGRVLPVVWIRYASPLIDLLPNGVDDGRMVVLLCLCGQPLAFVEYDLLLCRGPLSLPGLRNRRDKFCAAAALDNLLSRLTLVIKLPVPRRVSIGGVQDGMVEKWIRHIEFFSRPR